MARHRTPIEDTPAKDIYDELLRFVDAEQAIPNEHALWAYVMVPRGYEMTLPEYRYYFGRLIREHYIDVEDKTRSVRVLKRRIVPPDLVVPPK